jgi:hypothetical protein
LLYASDEKAYGATFAGRPLALLDHKFPDSVKNGVHLEYSASIKKFQAGNGYAVPGEFAVIAGIKNKG